MSSGHNVMDDVVVTFTVLGEPASKANSRTLGHYRPKRADGSKGKLRRGLIKSKKALNYTESFNIQCPIVAPLIEDDVGVNIFIYYATRRPDLDESVILDCMQGAIYKNDRQVKEKHVYHALDKQNPRAEIQVWLRKK